MVKRGGVVIKDTGMMGKLSSNRSQSGKENNERCMWLGLKPRKKHMSHCETYKSGVDGSILVYVITLVATLARLEFHDILTLQG